LAAVPLLLVALAGCGGPAALDAAATQTRVVELAERATLTAPTATATLPLPRTPTPLPAMAPANPPPIGAPTAPAGAVPPILVTPTPTSDPLRLILGRDIDEYEATIYARYAPGNPTGDYRPLYLALDPWLPKHPEFAAFNYWVRDVSTGGKQSQWMTYRTHYPASLRALVDEYLASRR
jgi:hypothetical protein